MSDLQPDIVIPDRPAFKAAEVCELLKVQPYVLRTWENEFKELGVAKSAGAPRVYRRKDVELAVRIRQLVFGDGLTLAGARRRLESERPPEPESELDIAEVVEAPTEQVATSRKGLDVEARARLRGVRDDLRALLVELSTPGSPDSPARAEPHPTAVTEPEATTPVREFTLEPLAVEPHLGDDDGRVVPVEVGKGKRKRRGA